MSEITTQQHRTPVEGAGPIGRTVELPPVEGRTVELPPVEDPTVELPPVKPSPIESPELPSATAPTVEEPPPAADTPRELGRRTLDDNASLFGALTGSLALTWVAFEGIFAFSGVVGFVVLWWAAFVLLYGVISSMAHPWPEVKDRLAAVIVTSAACLIGLALLSVLWHVLSKGWPALHHWNFYSQDMSGVRPTAPLTEGGIKHAILGSAIQVGIAVAISLPLGVGTAVYMTEVGGPFAKIVRTVVEAMTALPDILAGLFIYTVLIIAFHWEKTGMTASLALVVTIIPIIARSAEVPLRVVPNGLREASLALGASQWQTVRRVVLPTARSGLATAVILGVARIAGETAPLLIVSAASTFWNKDPFHEPMNSLPLYIISAVRSGQPLFIERGYGAAAVLLIIVLVLFATARFLARNKSGGR